MSDLNQSIDSRALAVLRRRPLVFSVALAGVVWTLWAVVGRSGAAESVIEHWPVSLTMVFGSLVGGGTSEGGGAVAFPIFTKVLHIPAQQARLFTFAIQSVGMTAASLTIVFRRIPVERTLIRYAAPGGIAGMVISSVFIAPAVPAPLVRIYFTALLAALGIALSVIHIRRIDDRNPSIPMVHSREKLTIGLAGLLGGVVSGLVGIGENTLIFIIGVLLFRISEKVITPTTVILMTIASLTGFACHAIVLRDFVQPVVGYWLAAVPIVVIGAPLGAVLCSRLSRRSIRLILVALIGADVVSTAILVPATLGVRIGAVVFLVFVTLVVLGLTRAGRYQPPVKGRATTSVSLGTRHVRDRVDVLEWKGDREYAKSKVD